jgi:hypothetical protein
MRRARLASTAALLAVALAATTALAQQPKAPSPPPAAAPAPPAAPAQPTPPGPYKAIPVTLAKPLGDPSLDAFRREVGEIVKKKDRAALAGKVVAKGFFWQREDSNGADAKKSGVDNLAAALGLDAKDASGWEALTAYLNDTTAEAMPEMKGVVCSPASPTYNEKDLELVTQATRTDPTEWAYPVSAGVEIRQKPDAKSPVVEKLGLILVRLYPDDKQPESAADWMRVVAPSGKTGYVQNTSLMPLVSDQLCYLKEASGWKIAGCVGGGGDQ